MKRRQRALLVIVALIALAVLLWLLRPQAVVADAIVAPSDVGVVGVPGAELPSAVPAVAPTIEAAPSASENLVRCALRMTDPVEGPVELVMDLTSEPGHTRHAFNRDTHIRLGQLEFDDAHPDSLHRGTITVPGYLKSDVAWSRGADGRFTCAEVVLRQGAVIVGTVRPIPRGEDDRVYVRGCDGFASVAADGTFYLEAAAEPCALHAERKDGWYDVKSDEVHVTPSLDAETEVALFLPEALQAGLGATFEESEVGMVFTRVRTGSAAAAAGLRAGDVIAAVNGVEVAGLERSAFADLGRGDVGSTVEVDVWSGGVRETRRLTRSYVPPDRVMVRTPNGVAMQDDPDAWLP